MGRSSSSSSSSCESERKKERETGHFLLKKEWRSSFFFLTVHQPTNERTTHSLNTYTNQPSWAAKELFSLFYSSQGCWRETCGKYFECFFFFPPPPSPLSTMLWKLSASCYISRCKMRPPYSLHFRVVFPYSKEGEKNFCHSQKNELFLETKKERKKERKKGMRTEAKLKAATNIKTLSMVP